MAKSPAAAAQKQYLPAISLLSVATPRRIAHVQKVAARGVVVAVMLMLVIFGWVGLGWVVPGVGLCQVLGCARCWVVPGVGLCQVLGCARENTCSTTNHTNDNSSSNNKTASHRPFCQRIQVDGKYNSPATRVPSDSCTISWMQIYEVCAQWFLRKESRPWASVLVSYLAL